MAMRPNSRASVPMPFPLDAERIVEILSKDARARFGAVEVVDEVASTNDILLDGVEDRDRALVARLQTEGRGRQGRRWVTPDGALTFSVSHAFPAVIPPALTLWVGIALVERLREMDLGWPCLIWPNDLAYGFRKFGGILTECHVRHGRSRCAVGVGVNVEAVPEVDRPATSIIHACGSRPSPNRLAASLIEAVSDCLARLDAGARRKIRERFDPYDGLKGNEARVVDANGQAYAGRAMGVDDHGFLRIQGKDGVRLFNSADARLDRR